MEMWLSSISPYLYMSISLFDTKESFLSCEVQTCSSKFYKLFLSQNMNCHYQACSDSHSQLFVDRNQAATRGKARIRATRISAHRALIVYLQPSRGAASATVAFNVV